MQYRVSGPDLAQVREIALKLAQVVATSHSAKNVNFDWIEPAREVRIQIDQDQARLLGLSSDALASVLNTVISGISISQVRDDIYLVDVVVRSTDEERASLATLSQLPVPLPNGRTVPLGQFATFEYTQSTPVVWRRDRIPTLTVQADVIPGVSPETVVNSLAPDIDSLAKSLPPSYAIAVGGTVEESKKSQASVIAVVPLMLLIMITVLMFQLEELSAPFPRAERGAAGLDRRGRCAAAFRSAPRLRGHSRNPGAARHDHQERCDPDRSNRLRAGTGKRRDAGGDRCKQRTPPSDRPDRHFHGSWHDSDRANSVLGSNGRFDHGWTSGCDAAHADRLANGLCGHVRNKTKAKAEPIEAQA